MAAKTKPQTRDHRVTVRWTRSELDLLDGLASGDQRSLADEIRILTMEAARRRTRDSVAE